MKILIADDESPNRVLMQKLLGGLGECHAVVNGRETVEAVEMALADQAPYDLVCLDIMMPEMDGQDALKRIRALERKNKISPKNEATILMITALDTQKSVVEAFFKGNCTDYLAKPITRNKLFEKLRDLDLVPEE